MSKASLESAAKVCKHLEGKLRPVGWHVALTGSCLYGSEPNDIDLILYPNNDEGLHDESAEDLMKAMGIKDWLRLGDESYARQVIRTRTKDGTQVDFFMLYDLPA
jgi:hypothetical protein